MYFDFVFFATKNHRFWMFFCVFIFVYILRQEDSSEYLCRSWKALGDAIGDAKRNQNHDKKGDFF